MNVDTMYKTIPAVGITVLNGQLLERPDTAPDFLCMSVDEALHALRNGEPALVAASDVAAVLAAWERVVTA